MSLTLSTIDGIEIAAADETTEGEERIEDLFSYTGPYMLRVENLSGAGQAQLGSNIKLTPWPDPDDGRTLDPELHDQRQRGLPGGLRLVPGRSREGAGYHHRRGRDHLRSGPDDRRSGRPWLPRSIR